MNQEPYWCKTAPNVPRVWSASSLAALADCPRRFELAYVEGWVSKTDSLDMLFGSRVHQGMQTFWHNRLGGMSKDESLCKALDAALLPLPPPTKQKQKGKTPLGVARSLIWYFEEWDPEKEIGNILILSGGPALELPFRIVLSLNSPDGDPYEARGYIDRLQTLGGFYTVWDYKTTSGSISEYYFTRFEIDIQNYLYTAATRMLSEFDFSQFLIDAMGVGVTYTDFARQTVPLTKGLVQEGLVDISETIKLAEYFAERNYWPKNTKACTFCQFKEICNKDPELRINHLETEFTEKRREFIEEKELKS